MWIQRLGVVFFRLPNNLIPLASASLGNIRGSQQFLESYSPPFPSEPPWNPLSEYNQSEKCRYGKRRFIHPNIEDILWNDWIIYILLFLSARWSKTSLYSAAGVSSFGMSSILIALKEPLSLGGQQGQQLLFPDRWMMLQGSVLVWRRRARILNKEATGHPTKITKEEFRPLDPSTFPMAFTNARFVNIRTM